MGLFKEPLAQDVEYSNSASGLAATDVQEAIDEIVTTGAGQPFTTLTDPAINAITAGIIDTKGGVVITLTGASNSQTLPAPTDATIAHKFTVINNDTSTNNINIIGFSTITLQPGEKVEFVYDGTGWASSEATGIWLDDGTNLIPQNSTRNIITAGSVKTDVLQPYTASASLAIKNSGGVENFTLTDDARLECNGASGRRLILQAIGDFGYILGSGGALSTIYSYNDSDAAQNFNFGSFAADNRRCNILVDGYLGLGEVAPETLLELTSTAPYITLHNSTAEDTAGGRESQLLFKGVQLGAEETTLAKIQASHDGAVDDQKGELIFYTNDGTDGDAPTERTSIDSSGQLIHLDTILSTGTVGSGSTLTAAGAGTRMIWYPRKAAFLAGRAIGTEWDEENIGDYSSAFGYNPTISGEASFVAGYQCSAGGNRSVAFGNDANASGSVAMAFGNGAIANNANSISLGKGNISSGDTSFATGYETIASGSRAFSSGNGTIATGGLAASFGLFTTAQSYASLVLGRYNVISGTTGSWVATEPAFVIGNGASAGAPANAFEVLKNGNTTLAELLTSVPAGLYTYGAAYTTGANLLSTPAAVAVTLTEGVDVGTNWAVNSPATGEFTYSGSTRYFQVQVNATLNTATGGAPTTITIKLQKQVGAGGWSDVAGAEVDRYLTGTSDTGSLCLGAVVSMASGDDLRLLVSSSSDTPTYTFNHVEFMVNAFN